MKLVTVVGARPQFIKAATVSRAIANHNQSNLAPQVHEVIVHTGQHHDASMSDVFFEQMAIPTPDHHLGVSGGGHGQMTGRMLQGIEEVLIEEKPDAVLVYGDTNSTLAGALAAAKLHIPVAHVEAGLRSFNMRMPEEINRILTDRISRWLFCPTETAVQNLQNEGFESFEGTWLENVGDVMYDAAIFYQDLAEGTPLTQQILEENQGNFYLATVHRAENTNSLARLRSIFKALEQISASTSIVIPLHPRTRKILNEFNISISQINTIDPVGYFEMLHLLKHCLGVITDSGGLQKEAYFFRKPCLTLRDETEWLELVKCGANFLVGADEQKILSSESHLKLANSSIFANKLYGAGKSAEKIIDILTQAF
ncbi:non-hydrolyzing UDP-N-acetylglucosamine 2-epimerase [Geitlerinema sp. PCC 7407]|uniref:non-hydrolyzing UDP-N-acetylglucosamine 2-epimerase n=1 Tax=Geitlerinema sp. PCC 7407 TaxID=1173025 RepID=UPI00029FC36B|nr:UDP-N-acetylglucosamine 2-epimerase (non-hydrolyzing) [Geitlerinema sp. PCC 7407]AFY66783.1 UDP-N-acetylglucosamine 2-epimerase [Geitlerinema sp. PCC 7407]